MGTFSTCYMIRRWLMYCTMPRWHLIFVYSNEPPETLLQHPPTFLTDLDLPTALTPARTTGLAHIHLKMKQLALLVVIKKNR